MNFFETIYCHTYQSNLDNKSKADARKNGNLMLSLMIIMWLCALVCYTFSFEFGDELIALLRYCFGQPSGETTGLMLGIGVLCLVYPLVSLTIGRKASYESIIKKYQALNKEQRISASGVALAYLFITVGVFGSSVMVVLIVSNYPMPAIF